ncbi:hypothetical protein EVAR_75584_1 [Eumeta japonica]|uniref:Uncharacterized protein n=1 Tax=Eumeta variegata TaxID=151549 RepID=A0A4C1TCN9_EUMVA|nr:hypothetical protein EVAR_75584_1 [Eumeta japonica]
MYATHMCNGCTTYKNAVGVVHPTQLLANRHLVKLGLIKSERKRCPLLTPPHCKKSADHRKKRAHREEAIRVRAYAAIAEIAVTAGPSFAGLS